MIELSRDVVATTIPYGHWNQLKSCFDPEIPVNIVELGLVYENKVEPRPDGGFKKEANIEVVFDPQWNQSMMSYAAKLQLGML